MDCFCFCCLACLRFGHVMTKFTDHLFHTSLGCWRYAPIVILVGMLGFIVVILGYFGRI
jgi:hypothetical protein